MDFEIWSGDSLDLLTFVPSNSVDAVVTDPPYGLKFMSRKWDYNVPGADLWAEVLRVLKPGGHLLAFAGTRTQHRMAGNIEDAGFDIRDLIAWVYGSGMPKSLDVSKAIDSRKDWAALESLGAAIKTARTVAGFTQNEAARRVGLIGPGETLGGGGFMWFETGRLPTRDEWPRIKAALAMGDEFDAAFEAAEREVVGTVKGAMSGWRAGPDGLAANFVDRDITVPATDAAKDWAGWGTSLKPAIEPVTVARKPFPGTVASNVLRFGTGAVNVDGCRVGEGGECGVGRFPANLIHDGSDEVVELFPDRNGAGSSLPNVKITGYGGGIGTGKSEYLGGERRPFNAGTGSAARFFYCAKPSKAERGEGNVHPTVKPVALMRYLCRLVTPPGGLVLDPFAGSGTTGIAARAEGFRFLGIEREAEFAEIARRRVAGAE